MNPRSRNSRRRVHGEVRYYVELEMQKKKKIGYFHSMDLNTISTHLRVYIITHTEPIH